MNIFIALSVPLLLLIVPNQLEAKKRRPHNRAEGWTYEDPKSWEGQCQTGVKQSPIDIRMDWFNDDKTQKLHLINYYKNGSVTMANNGHSVVVSGFDKWAEQPHITGDGLGNKYVLSQFHFHWSQNENGSEHTVDGAHFNAELHFVHVKEGIAFLEATELSDGLAVLGVFYKIGYDGDALFALEKGLSQVRKDGASVQIEWFVPDVLLPDDLTTFFRYNGSLTTPECNEAVVWTVFDKPVPISRAQMKLLRAINGHDGKPISANVRPVQPFYRKARKYGQKVSAAGD